jgi:hypothetical protein
MSQKEMFTVLRQKEIVPGDWSATGPGATKLQVLEHSRTSIGSNAKSGIVRFVVTADEGVTKHELIGVVKEDGSEAITRDGVALSGANIDGGIAGKPILKGFPPKLRFRGHVIVKFQFDDGDDTTDPDEYRFEGKFGEIKL